MAVQAALQPRLSHDVLRKHTEMNEYYSNDAPLVEQIQALTATHQQLAQQMQDLVKSIANQHNAAQGRHLHDLSPFMFAATVALALVLGILIAKLLL